jgi:hypothetical protein
MVGGGEEEAVAEGGGEGEDFLGTGFDFWELEWVGSEYLVF